jgi:hypothetical protein
MELLDGAFIRDTYAVSVQPASFDSAAAAAKEKEAAENEKVVDKQTLEEQQKQKELYRLAKQRRLAEQLGWEDDPQAAIAKKQNLKIVILKPMFDPKEAVVRNLSIIWSILLAVSKLC